MDEFSAMHNLALRLISHEAATLDPSGTAAQAAVRVCEKLRVPLTTLAGADGYRALIGRALALTRADIPVTVTVQVRQDGSLEASGPDEQGHDTDKVAQWGTALVARLLGLLITFIGEGLTMRLVHDVWPDAPLNGIDSKMEKL